MRRRLEYLQRFFVALIPQADVRVLVLQVPLLFAGALLLGLALHGRVPSHPRWAQADALAEEGQLTQAERLYWQHLRQGPVTVPLLMAFLDNHGVLATLMAPVPEALPTRPRQGLVVGDDAIERLLTKPGLPAGVALLGRFYWQFVSAKVDPALRTRVLAAADRPRPLPWANHVLGREAITADRLDEAARRFEREGLTFAGHREDARKALRIWVELERWDVIGRKLRDRRYRSIADPSLRHEYALHAGRWLEAARWLLIANSRPPLGPLLLALVGGLMWFGFVAQLGKLRERPVFRGVMYAVAFLLGVLSVVPTLLLVTLEEHVVGLRETGQIGRDAIYFVAGVGLREELSKLLFFVPLLPVLRRFGSRLDVLACGAMVGLGFAVEENLGYFAGGAGGAAVGRFLTANFLHIAMTALCAQALDRLIDAPEARSLEVTRTFLTVVLMHGLYDLFSSAGILADFSFLSMAVFILLTRQFLGAVSFARGRSQAHDRFARRLVQAVAVVAAAAFAYACALAGPIPAAEALLIGLAGDAIIIFVCVREVRAA